MSGLEAIVWSGVKAAVVGLLGLTLLLRRRSARGWLLLAAVPAIIPSLVPGYAYRAEALRWVNQKWAVDLLHGALCGAKFLPWGLLVAYLLRSPDGRRARQTWDQTRARRSSWRHRRGRVRLWLAANAGVLGGAVAMGVLTFTESEMAGLLQARGWPEWTLRKMAGGVPPAVIVRSLLPAVSLAGLSLLVLQRLRRSSSNGDFKGGQSGQPSWAWPVWSVLAIGLTALVPALRLAGDIPTGLAAVPAQPRFVGELLTSLVIAAVTATLASALVRVSSRPAGAVVVVTAAAFGLLGPLLTSVSVQAFADVAGWPWLLSTPAAHMLTLTAVLTPLAWLLRAVVRRRDGRAALTARQLTRHRDPVVRRAAARRLWRRVTGPSVAAWGLLFITAFWDLLVASTLAAPRFTTAPGRLYNLAHYGQSDALAAMLAICAAAAATVPAAALAGSAVWSSRRHHAGTNA